MTRAAAYDGYVVAYAPGGAPSMAHLLDEEVELLRVIARAVTTPKAAAETALLDRAAVAALFGVSTKTISRLVKPTSQTRKRGRAWYDPADVERQLRALGPLPSTAPRASTTTRRPKRARKSAALGAHTRSNDERVDAIEQRLLAPTRGRKRAR